MTFRESLKIALLALKTNKIRSFLTMLGIIIGVSAVILLVAIGTGLKNYIIKQFERLGADNLIVLPGKLSLSSSRNGQAGGMRGAGIAVSKFTFYHLNKIQRKAKKVKAITPYIESSAKLKYKNKTRISRVIGVGANYQEIRKQKTIKGDFFNLSHYNGAKKVAVIGPTIAEKLFSSENPIGKKLTIGEQQYTILGIMEEQGGFAGVDIDDQVYIPGTTAIKQFDLDYIQSFIIQSLSSDEIEETKKEVEKILLTDFDEDDFSVMDTKNVLNIISQVLAVMTAALGGIAAISLLVGGIGIMNIMLVSVTERTKEIGLRKAVGASSNDILIQFLTEAVILSLSGGIIGITLGSFFTFLLNRFIPAFLTWWSIVIAFLVCGLIGIIFGSTPAAKAAKLDPIEALRYE